MKFEWDENKNRENIRKHGVSFEQAVQIFKGYTADRIDDGYYGNEIREISVGMINGTTILVVVYTDRDNIYRIISARPALKNERKFYGKELQKTTYN